MRPIKLLRVIQELLIVPLAVIQAVMELGCVHCLCHAVIFHQKNYNLTHVFKTFSKYFFLRILHNKMILQKILFN